MSLAWLLWADIAAAALPTRTNFEFGRLQGDWDAVLPAVAYLAVLLLMVLVYWRDAREQGPWWASLLILLRGLALTALLVVYLQPQWRNERDLVQPSRTLVVVDTSLSMNEPSSDEASLAGTRSQEVVQLLTSGDWLERLRCRQEVSLWRFDNQVTRLAILDRLPSSNAPREADPAPTDSSATAWPEALVASGVETRLGQGLRQALADERAAPLAGVVVFTDGQQNAGLDISAAVALARELKVPVFPVGLGSNRPSANVRISDFVVPARAYPGDKYSVSGTLHNEGLAGKTVTVELVSRSPGRDAASAPLRVDGTQQITLAASEANTVTFELTPASPGRTQLELRVLPPVEDRNPADNRREAAVEVVERRTQVLLFAGGASREYQFLRNILRRDKQSEVDVLLQTGSAGVSQDARTVLDDFPATPADLFQYDAIVAFDPDWRELAPAQIDLLERWVDRQSGGLIVVAGPVATTAWTQAPGLDKIRALYPVEFPRRFAALDDGQNGSKQPWPLEFTRPGLEAQFLWLADSAAASAAVWSDFPGVYGYYEVRGKKPLATVYARYSDPRTSVGEQLPIYMAGQPYGGGQVFYLGSGEMWRLRSLGDSLLEMFYTKLIRQVSQYRLLRGSTRGVVQIEGDRFTPGASVEVTARLTTPRFEPLEQAQVHASVVGPGATVEPIVLTADPARVGSYRGLFVVRREGSYRVELVVPESNDQRLASAPVQVTVPELEREHPERNDALLAQLAAETGGAYYAGIAAAVGRSAATPPAAGETPSPVTLEPLLERLRDVSRTTTVTAEPERLAENEYVLLAIVGILCVEWLLRRLLKLA